MPREDTGAGRPSHFAGAFSVLESPTRGLHDPRVISNVLAERYASPALQAIWSADGRIVLEREFWIAVMKAQRDLGLDIPEAAIAAYERSRTGWTPRPSWRGKRSPATM